MACTGQMQPSLPASAINAVGASAGDAVVKVAPTVYATRNAATLAACAAAAATNGRALANDAATTSSSSLVPAASAVIISNFLPAAAMPAAAATPTETSRVVSAPAARGLHRSAPVLIAAAFNDKAASTDAGTAAPAAVTAVRAAVRAAPIAC